MTLIIGNNKKCWFCKRTQKQVKEILGEDFIEDIKKEDENFATGNPVCWFVCFGCRYFIFMTFIENEELIVGSLEEDLLDKGFVKKEAVCKECGK